METYNDAYGGQQQPPQQQQQQQENGGGGNFYYRPHAQYGGVNPASGNPTPPPLFHATSSGASTSTTNNSSDQATGSNSAAPPLPNPNTRRMSTSSRLENKEEDVPVGFDEGVLRGLCDMDCALALLTDRIKQSIASTKQVGGFFRQRAEVEEKYSRGLSELARTTNDLYAKADCKAGSFVTAFQSGLRVQENIGQNRLRFVQRLYEMSEELAALAREGEKQRKLYKDTGARYQADLQESEQVMDKAKARFDATAEELERILVAKEGENFRDAGMRTQNAANAAAGTGGAPAAGKKSGIGKGAAAMKKGLFKGKNPAQMAKHEEDVRARMASASEAFRKAVLESQAKRQEYFNFQLPKIVRLLKDCADELDMGTQYHLTRYAYMYESTVVGEGTTLAPLNAEDGPGLKSVFEAIDNRSDFKSYMQNYAVARGTPRGPRREGLYDEGYMPAVPHVQAQQQQNNLQAQQAPPQLPPLGNGAANGSTANLIAPSQGPSPASTQVDMGPSPTSTFGVDLGDQLARDEVEIPKVVLKCTQAIEAYGLDSMGIYRISGTTSRVQALKNALDKDIDAVDVMDAQWSSDINVVSSALKLWFRELPEPLLTFGLYHGFVDAAREEKDRLRHIRLHEQVNELPDPNYATLKFFMGHLDKIRRHEGANQMSASNLSIVFGPTLLGAPPEEGGLNLEHMNFQCKAIETILEKYQEIFVEDDEGAGESKPPA